MVFFHTCGPNEALVVSGMFHSTPVYIVGGRAWVWPFVQKAQKINLNTLTLEVHSPRVYTKLGVPISVTGVAQIKVQGQNEEMLAAACQQLLNKSEREISLLALETVEAHQRAIMGLLTVEEIYQDRQKFSDKVFEVSSSDLVNMGITVVSYTLKDIKDSEGYLKALGQGRTAEVKRDARMGEADASRDSKIREANAEEQRLHAKYANDVEIAKSKRTFELEKAGYDQEVNANKAKADLAYQLQAAKTKQKIKEEEMEVRVVERTQQIALQQQEIARRERELDATVKRPAEAEKYRLEKIAQAEKSKRILEAEAKAEAERMRGEAQAYAIAAKAAAEAEQMKKKAEAWQDYKDAAMVDMVLEALPKVAAEVASPLSNGVDKITMVSTGDGEVGAAKLTAEVIDIMAKLPEVVKKMTGVDISKAMVITQEK